MRPLIGLTVGATQAKDGLDYVRLRTTYVQAVEDAGGLPVLVPPLTDEDALVELLERLDGLLLPGGGDVEPGLYGEVSNGSQPPNPGLDRVELEAVRFTVAHDVPTLGICRGQQVINVALGGSLVQHMAGHALEGPRDRLHHGLRVAAGSRLAHVFGATHFDVNSHHHQAIKRLADGLVAVAWADDGTIEGVEGHRQTWLTAVQFHPEDLVPAHEPSRRLLAEFVSICRLRRASHVPASGGLRLTV